MKRILIQNAVRVHTLNNESMITKQKWVGLEKQPSHKLISTKEIESILLNVGDLLFSKKFLC